LVSFFPMKEWNRTGEVPLTATVNCAMANLPFLNK
jgi:hypothetical protein